MKDSKGFTLLELFVVIAIIGILSALGIAQFNSYKKNAYRAQVELVTKDIKGAIEGVIIGRLMEISGVYGTELVYEVSKGINAAALSDANVTGAPLDNPGPFPDLYFANMLPHLTASNPSAEEVCFRVEVKYHSGGTNGLVTWQSEIGHVNLEENVLNVYVGSSSGGDLSSNWVGDISNCTE